MKIRQIEIKDFGAIKNKTLKFTSGLNVLYDENGQVREAVRSFIEKMLFGNAEFPYAGILWFESGGRNYRLTRDLHRETPYSELLCETSGELIDADRISDSKVTLGISESVFENAICIAPLKGNTGSEIVREVQRQIAGFQWSADRTVDLRCTSQRLKMTRKGYQVQVERRKKADQLEKGKVSTTICRQQWFPYAGRTYQRTGKKEPYTDYYNVCYRYCGFFSSNLYGNEHADSGSGNSGGNCGSACVYDRNKL